MKNNGFKYVLSLTLLFVLIAGGLAIGLSEWTQAAKGQAPAPAVPVNAPAGGGVVTYNPPNPQDAPADLQEAVLFGYNILNDTQKYAKSYVGNQLNCTNCHFKAGLTEGGVSGGISLVGVGAKYPMYRSRSKYATDLSMRTSECFQRSLNGTAPAIDSKEMQAILAYYQWISKGIPIYSKVSWLGIPKLTSTHTPDATNGAALFAAKCAPCHGKDGSGNPSTPPLWGNGSFNDGAGMASPATLAAFAKLNMPYGSPNLTEEEALDLGAFVDSQPRPHFTAK